MVKEEFFKKESFGKSEKSIFFLKKKNIKLNELEKRKSWKTAQNS